MGNKGSASSSYHKSVRFTIGNSRVVPNAGLLIASGMLEECSFDDALSRFTRKTQKYSSADIMKAMLASILTGNLGFEDIRQLEKDPAFYMDALHMKGIPSEATYRQRITELALDHGPETTYYVIEIGGRKKILYFTQSPICSIVNMGRWYVESAHE